MRVFSVLFLVYVVAVTAPVLVRLRHAPSRPAGKFVCFNGSLRREVVSDWAVLGTW